MAISAENKKVTELFRGGEYREARKHAEEAVTLSREAFVDLEATASRDTPCHRAAHLLGLACVGLGQR